MNKNKYQIRFNTDGFKKAIKDYQNSKEAEGIKITIEEILNTLADQLAVSPDTVRHWYKGHHKPSIFSLEDSKKIAYILNCDYSQIYRTDQIKAVSAFKGCYEAERRIVKHVFETTVGILLDYCEQVKNLARGRSSTDRITVSKKLDDILKIEMLSVRKEREYIYANSLNLSEKLIKRLLHYLVLFSESVLVELDYSPERSEDLGVLFTEDIYTENDSEIAANYWGYHFYNSRDDVIKDWHIENAFIYSVFAVLDYIADEERMMSYLGIEYTSVMNSKYYDYAIRCFDNEEMISGDILGTGSQEELHMKLSNALSRYGLGSFENDYMPADVWSFSIWIMLNRYFQKTFGDYLYD